MNNEQREHIKSMAYRIRRHAETIAESMQDLEKCSFPDIAGISDAETLSSVNKVFTDALYYCEAIREVYKSEFPGLQKELQS